LMIRTIWGEEYKSLSSLLCIFLHSYLRNNLKDSLYSTVTTGKKLTASQFPS
jgi:hypothetical protein